MYQEKTTDSLNHKFVNSCTDKKYRKTDPKAAFFMTWTHITHQMSSKRRLSLGSLLHLHYWHQARTDCSHESSSQQCTLRGEVSWNSRSTLITIWTIGITWHNIAEHKAWKTSLEQHLMAKSLEAQVLEGVVVSKIEEPFGGFSGASPSIWWGTLRSYPYTPTSSHEVCFARQSQLHSKHFERNSLRVAIDQTWA